MQAIFRAPQFAQSISPLAIDWANPITRGLRFSAYNALTDYAVGPWNYVTGIQPRRNVGVSLAGGPRAGIAPSFNGSTSAATARPNLGGIAQLTIGFWLYWNAYSNGSGKMAFEYRQDASGDTAGSFYCYPDDSSGLVSFAAASSSTQTAAYKIARPSAAAWHYYISTMDLTRNTSPILDVQVDGSFVSGSGTTTYVGISGLSDYSLSIMSRPAGTPTAFSAGRIAHMNVWARVLPVNERMSMFRDSLQILRGDMMAVGTPASVVSPPPTSAASRWFLVQ